MGFARKVNTFYLITSDKILLISEKDRKLIGNLKKTVYLCTAKNKWRDSSAG